MKRKILILISDVAAGHLSTARALKAVTENKHPDVEVKIVDILKELKIAPFDNVQSGHDFLSKWRIGHHIFGFFYALSKTTIGDKVSEKFIQYRLLEKMVEFIKAENPDVVISDYFIVSQTLRGMKKHLPEMPLIEVTADLIDVPRGYANKAADLVFVATPEAVNKMKKYGVSETNIRSPHFPANPELENFRPRDEVLSEIGFNENTPSVLITGGGSGTVSMLKVIDEMVKQHLQIILMAGKNAEVFHMLDSKYGDIENIKILQFVTNMQDYLNAVDLVISKPGPATLVEIEMFQKKAAITRPVGAQENDNVEFALQNPNFRYVGSDRRKLLSAINELINSDYVEFEPRFNFRSAEEIMDEVMELIYN